MKRHLQFIVLAILIFSLLGFWWIRRHRAFAQTSLVTLGPVSVPTIGAGNNETNSSTQFHQLTWRISGTVSTCTVALDSSVDGVSWSAGGVIGGQTCTSNGTSVVVNSVVNFVRINVTALSGGGTVTIVYTGFNAAPLSAGAVINPSKVNNVIFVDGVKYTTITAALTDLPTGGGCVILPNGYTETLTANITINKSNTCIWPWGTAVINQGAFQVLISTAGGSNNVSFISNFPWSTGIANQNNGLSFVGYTGASCAFCVGVSGTTTEAFYMDGVHINMSAAQAGAQAFKAIALVKFGIVRSEPYLSGTVNNQIGWLYDGDGGVAQFTGLGNIEDVWVQQGAGGSTGAVGTRFQNGCVSIRIVGGEATLNNAVGTVGYDVTGATTNGIYFVAPDVEQAVTGITVSASFTFAVAGSIRLDSSTTNFANFSAAANGNKLISIGSVKTVIDAGTLNSVVTEDLNQINTRFWNMVQSPTTFAIISQVAGSTGSVISIAAGGNTTIKSQAAGGAGLLLSNAGSLSPDAASTVADLGIQFPYRDLYLSPANAVANRMRFTMPTGTGQRTGTIPDGNVSLPMVASLVTTAATTDNVTIQGMTASGHCSITPTNVAAATNLTGTFISAKAANQITVTHAVVANLNYDIFCTSS